MVAFVSGPLLTRPGFSVEEVSLETQPLMQQSCPFLGSFGLLSCLKKKSAVGVWEVETETFQKYALKVTYVKKKRSELDRSLHAIFEITRGFHHPCLMKQEELFDVDPETRSLHMMCTNSSLKESFDSFFGRHPLSSHVFEVLEFLPRGTLGSYITKIKENTSLSKNTPKKAVLAFFVLLCITDALAYLHSLHIFHGDIKPENIMFSDRGYPKIIDFDTVQKLETPSSPIVVKRATYSYAAPEIIASSSLLPKTSSFRASCRKDLDPVVSLNADMWSLGATVYEIMTGTPPFGTLRPDTAYLSVCHTVGFKNPLISPATELSRLEAMLLSSNRIRPTSFDFLEHLRAVTLFQSGIYDSILEQSFRSPFMDSFPEIYNGL